MTLLRMRDERRAYGPNLMAYVDAQLAHLDESPTAFAVERVGVSASQFGRWRAGEILPRLDTIVDIADALGRPVLEVLANTVGATEQLVTLPAAEPSPLEECIRDSDVSAPYKDMLLDMLATIRRHERGESEVTAGNTRARNRRPRRK